MNDHELRQLQEAVSEIWDVARRLGLDPFPTHFELVPASIMYEFGAYGLPGRFSHWTWGKAYHQMKSMYDHGLSKIYELVVNTDPTYAFLMEGNSLLQNKLVIAHVLAHSDFFKHNAYFSPTSRQMIEGVSANADRIRAYEFEHGKVEVERFLDAVLAIQEHVEPSLYGRRSETASDKKSSCHGHGTENQPRPSPYDDLFDLEHTGERVRTLTRPPRRIPEEPEKDVLLFLAEHATDLEDWQRDVIHIVRSEMLYFYPQMRTKIANEGWAAFWHVQILRELDLSEQEYVDFIRLHTGVLAPSRQSLNPYYVGYKVFEDIRRRWDEPSQEDRERLGLVGGEGLKKIFEVRSLENDVSFLRNYLTAQLVEDLDLYVYRLQDSEWVIVDKDWEKVRDQLVANLTNCGQPYILVVDGDYKRNRELYLRHSFEGQPLDLGYAEKTLRYIAQIWGRSVHLETVVDGEPTLLSHDGQKNYSSKVAGGGIP